MITVRKRDTGDFLLCQFNTLSYPLCQAWVSRKYFQRTERCSELLGKRNNLSVKDPAEPQQMIFTATAQSAAVAHHVACLIGEVVTEVIKGQTF